MTHLAKNYFNMNELVDKFYEKNEMSDIICEECSKLSGKTSKANFEKHHSVLKPPMNLRIFLSLFLLGRSPCFQSVLLVGWWSSNPITEATETLVSVPIMYLMCYYISLVFVFLTVTPTNTPLPIHYPLPCPLLTPPLPLPLLGPSPPNLTISLQSMPQASTPSPFRYPESAGSQCTVRTYSTSSLHMIPFPQTLPPPSLSP